MKQLGILLLTFMLGHSAASADEPVSFEGKSITLIVTSAAGGGTDLSARLVANYIASHLPGKPNVIVRNIPGAQGVVGMNYLVNKVAPDGLALTVAGATLANPLVYRVPAAQFDPTTFPFIGGSGRGGSVILIRKDAEARLYDKSAAPVIMGSLGGVPRAGSQTAAWGAGLLGWNMKWVVGYPGTNELMLALDRGEVDMTATANLFLVKQFLAGGRFKVLVQTGIVRNGRIVQRADYGDAPLMASLLESKVTNPLVRQAYEYWSSNTALDKWIAVPPKTPEAYIRAYREAYQNAFTDPAFAEMGKNISDDLEPMSWEDVEFLMKKLGATPPEAIAFITEMLRKQGLETE
jgi:tripartite-type tricarboxylate transporter receptor subunit TctC